MKPIFILSMFLFFSFPAIVHADDDTRTVEAEFNRCKSTMERLKREMLRFEEAVKRLKGALDGSTVAKNREIMQSFLKLENRVDYLRGRIDRSAGQRDKIRGDLKSAGATCPSCVTSSVRLYCRNSETLTREIEEWITNAAALEDRIGAGVKRSTGVSDRINSSSSPVALRTAIVESMAGRKSLLDSCGSDAGKMLWKQCEINLQRADSLQAIGALAESKQALKLVELLLVKAIKKCGNK